MANGQELIDKLESILDEVDGDVRAVVQEAIDGIALRNDLMATMNEFIESEYRGEFEDTLDHSTQEQYRDFFELDVRESDDFLWLTDGHDDDDE
jgi:hypothetical protein